MSKRPLGLHDYLGQEHIKQQLRIAIQASKKLGNPLKHTLLWGNPGLGKTTLAEIIANEMGAKFTTVVATALKDKWELLRILEKLSDPPAQPDILFLDEIHNLSLAYEEVLYSAMEDFAVDLEMPEGLQRFYIPQFTLIGATTRAGDISRPLRDRFGLHFELQNYTANELSELLFRYAKRNFIDVTREATLEIGRRSRGVARNAIHFLENCRDYATIFNGCVVDNEVVEKQFEIMGIDENGLNPTDYKVLEFLSTQAKPVGLSAVCSAIDIDKNTFETIVEPFLYQTRFISRTPRGREITTKGRTLLGLESNNLIDERRRLKL